jgi:hypothetical protein
VGRCTPFVVRALLFVVLIVATGIRLRRRGHRLTAD